MNFELKPCPFCGGEAIVSGCDDTLWSVICNKCDASIGYKETEREVIEEWNCRVQPEFEYFELRAIHTVFTSPSPSRRYTDGYNTIVDKCEQALEGREW